jgi:hypothetical protein
MIDMDNQLKGESTYQRATNKRLFRQELSRLLAEASRNGITVEGRSWECTPDESGKKWDVEIHRVASSGPSDTR